MSKNSLLYVLVVVAVVLAGAVALVPGKAASPADRSYDAIELKRSGAGKAAIFGDRSYDAIEFLRGNIQTDRSYDQIETERGSQVGPAGLGSGDTIDSATRSYMAWAKAVEQQSLAYRSTVQAEGLSAGSAKADALNGQTEAERSFHTPPTSNLRLAQGSIQCLDNECTYQLPDGRWAK